MSSNVSINKATAIVRSKLKGTELIEAIAAALDEAFQDGCDCQRTETFLASVVARQRTAIGQADQHTPEPPQSTQ